MTNPTQPPRPNHVQFLNQLLRDFRPDWEVVQHVARRAHEFGLEDYIPEPTEKPAEEPVQ